MTDKRIRVNAKQTAKGLWYFDVTVEVGGEQVDADDVDILKIIQGKELEFRAAHKPIVGDE